MHLGIFGRVRRSVSTPIPAADMCGIVGMLTFGPDVSRWRGQIEGAMTLMTRRGPDDSGLWSDGEHCLLGFRRLSILDLSDAGNQPMLTRDGRYALVFNGELYNFREIRKTLEDRGVSFRSTGDAEVVLCALAEFGEAALEWFNGMFALAFYDTHARRLLLARDHAAIKPLYVLRHPEGLLFASQYDQVLSHPWARVHSVNPGALGLYLNLGYIPPPFAILEESAALEAGTWMSVERSGRTATGRYFTFPQVGVPELCGNAAFEAVDAAVESSVRRQMVSDVPIGVLLSGGIDSPLVAAAMRQATNAAIPAFTLGTHGDAFDESPDARRYAKALGLRHVVEHIAPSDVLALLDEVVAAYSEPADDYSIFPTALISRVARKEVTVVLSGDGGDDLFWGYPERMIRPLRSTTRDVSRGWYASLRRGVGLATDDVASPAEQPGAAHLRGSRFVDVRRLRSIFPSLPALPDDFGLFTYEGEGVDRLAQWIRWNEYSGHLARVLQKVDRASMHHSLEVRVPLLDREVIEVAARVDWRSCVDLRREMGKLPLRAALGRRVGFQTLRKRGFDVPMASWLRGPLRALFEDLVLSRHELLGLPLERTALATVFRRHVMRVEPRRGCCGASSAWHSGRLAISVPTPRMRDHRVDRSGDAARAVTVVVAVYNGASTIDACVSSLLAVRYPRESLEIVVVDNASIDGTLERLRAFGESIRVLHEATRGASAARNCGIRGGRGELIAFTDADGEVESEWLAALVAPLGDPGVGVVGGPILSRAGGNHIERFGELIHDQRRAIEDEHPPYVASGNWASRREVLTRAGLFDEALLRGQDVDLSWRIFLAGYRLVYAPGAIVRHRNERTVWGLMNEGYVHGLNGVRVGRKHMRSWPHVRRRPGNSGRRLVRDLRRLAAGPDRRNGVLALLFDTGKAAGEWIALARGQRK